MTDIDNFDYDKFLQEQEEMRVENERMEKLIARYKEDFPKITALWDTSVNALKFNDINESIISSGITILEAPFADVWNGIYEPDIYAGCTLWDSASHDSEKIARVIESWELGTQLSPIFFVKHLTKEIGLVADGKHRLTVSHHLGIKTLPFMVETTALSWVSHAIPSAKKI